jgi:hypothetical protein
MKIIWKPLVHLYSEHLKIHERGELSRDINVQCYVSLVGFRVTEIHTPHE